MVRKITDNDERVVLLFELDRLQDKYRAKTYDQAFGKCPTPEQASDASWWRFYEKKLKMLQ